MYAVQDIIKRITKGPVTVVLVYADWCGHCHTLMPHFKAASQLAERNVEVMSIRDDMLPLYNKAINSLNRSAPELKVEGYPSVVLVSSDGTKLSEIASTKEALESAMVNVAPVAVEAGLAEPVSLDSVSNRRAPSPRTESPEEIVNNVIKNEIVSPNRNSVRNISMEPKGSAAKYSFEHLQNDKIINQEEDIGVAPSVSINDRANRPSTQRISDMNISESAIKKSPNMMNIKEIEEITSLRAPVGSQSNRQNSQTTSSLIVPSLTSDTIPIRTKAMKGGSLYEIMSQSAYRLAPAAVLLATAAAVMKKTRSHKQSRRTRSRRSRR
jgi:thiol-disulfide isomerase/thioredoxin